MKILFILENYHPHLGGVETVFKHLCEGLAAKGHKVDVLTHRMKGAARHEEVGGVHITRIGCMESRYVFTLAAIPAAIRLAKDADIIHTTTYNGAFPAWIASRVRKKPALITIHEVWLGKWRKLTSLSRPSARVHEWLEWLVYHIPRFTRYVCVSKATQESFAKALPNFASRATTIHNGFDPAPWAKPRKGGDALRAKHHLKDAFVILASGRPGPTKGFEYLIDAMPHVRAKIPNAQLLLLLSDGKQYQGQRAKLQARAGAGVKLLPAVGAEELAALRQMADCLVVPSTSEGFGYAVLESCASGVPVVATRAGSIPEVICGRHVLVAPKSAHAIADGIMQVKQKQYTTTPLKHFSWEKMIASYEEEYTRLVKS